MKLFLKKDIVKILIIIIFVVLLLWIIWANEIKSYSTLDKYVQKNNSFITSAEVVASNDEYALCIKKSFGNLMSYDILNKNKKGTWKLLARGWDYDVKDYIVSNNQKLNFFVDNYYIKKDNLIIAFVYYTDYFPNQDVFHNIETTSDSSNSVFYTNKIQDEHITYTYTAFIQGFDSSNYILYVNGHPFPFKYWNEI
ncbi:MAG: hypothetical protein AAGU14_10960 [Eubacteriaceae bacterium]